MIDPYIYAAVFILTAIDAILFYAILKAFGRIRVLEVRLEGQDNLKRIQTENERVFKWLNGRKH
jgi:hypothetical protein